MKFRRTAATTFSTALLLACSSSGGGPSTSDGGTSGTSTSSGSGSGGGTSSGTGNGSSSGTTSTSTSGSSSGTAGTSTSSGAGTSSGTTSSSGGGDASTTEGACPQGVVGHCDEGATYPTYTGYTLKLVEDFPGPIDLDTDPIFTWSDGSPESGQTRLAESQITFANGTMMITAAGTPTAAGTSYAESAYTPNPVGTTTNPGPVGAMNVLSGEFRSKYNNYRYGRYEVKYNAPTPNPTYGANPMAAAAVNDGNFLSTMFIFRTPKWLTWNEIDIELEPSIPTAVAYNVVDAQNQQHYPANNNAAGQTATIAGYDNTQTHIYAFEWTPTSVTWFLDGNMIHSFAGAGNDPIPSKSAKIMMNLWIFGSNAAFGDPTKNVYPFTATYDYFHFYQLNTETTYPCSPTPTCLPAEDLVESQNNPKETNYPN